MKKVLQPTLAAIREHYLPFLLIQICGGVTVFAYYHSPEFQNICAHAARWKNEGGFFFSAWTTASATTILPEIAKALTGKFPELRSRNWWKDFFYIFLLYALIGVLTDMLYRTQGKLWGYQLNFQTLAVKTLIDQFIWCPFFDAPFAALFFHWRRLRFNLFSALKSYNLSFYKTRVLPLLVPMWLYWFPIAILIYTMPENLQFCFFLLMQAAWSLIAIFILRSDRKIKERKTSRMEEAAELS